jgi:hypothetical protein
MFVSTHRRRQGNWDTALDAGRDGPQTLVLVFADRSCDSTGWLSEILAAYPRSVVIGCSTAGEILGERIEDDTVTVAVAQFEHTAVALAAAPLPDIGSSYMAGQALAGQLHRDDLRSVFVLSTGLNVNGSELVRGIDAGLAADVIVTGGLAADGPRFEHTWVIVDSELRSGYVTAVGLYGDHVRVGHGSRGGWEIFGPERRVTRSDGNILYELDGRPALELYKRYLGDLAAGLPATGLRFPLALRDSAESEKQLVRTIVAVDEADQSMTFAGDLPQGWMARLMRANFDQLICGAEEAAMLAAAPTGDVLGDRLAIAVSCVGRRMVLGESTEEEVEATLDILPAGTRQIGFYSYGELSPFATGSCDLHNQTMTLTMVQEV